MRDILFRGKRVDNGKWVSGRSLLTVLQDNNYLYYIPQQGENFKANPSIDNDRILSVLFGNFYQVDPKTIGQYTGLKVNGEKIFEGDVLRNNTTKEYNVVRYDSKGYFAGAYVFDGFFLCDWDLNVFSMAGNIYDNPELLEVK